LFNKAVSPATFFNPQIAEKVEEMTSLLGKLAFVVATAGGLSLAALSPAPVEAGAIQPGAGCRTRRLGRFARSMCSQRV
jgi:hypothetical protein